MNTVISTIEPTPFLPRDGEQLRQIARLTVRHEGPGFTGVMITRVNGLETATPVTLPPGETVLEVELAEVSAPGQLACELRQGDTTLTCRTVPWQPPRRWVVHIVQLSHHDVGYTDLASHVIPEHDCRLDTMLDMADATRRFPDDARFRAVIEQAWSIDHFLKHARPERAAAMIELLRRGDLEMTALFGNMTTELCGHETLARSVYHAFRLKREHGIPIVSAEHNDIPGFCWGLSQVLTEAGIKMICPGLPKYYSWGNPGAPSFWDEAALFGAAGIPGAFWWEAPGGKRLLFWCNNQGCGGGADPKLPGLAERLEQLEAQGYPYTALRFPVTGGSRDNSPYIEGYAHTIRDWNARWAYPRLVSSTNARFYRDLLPQLPASLPVFRGEVPGQDYPVGAASTAAATAVNRRNHTNLPTAESLATAAAVWTDYRYQAGRIATAQEEVLWHDEHTWGHHFPCGPTAAAADLEKAVHAHRAAALVHDVVSKAMARVADAVHLAEPGIHLVVFNPLPRECSGMVSTPLREIDNCGSTMGTTKDGLLRGFLLHDRWHVNPPIEIVEGKFDVLDVATGRPVPYQIVELDSALGSVPYAARRLGLGAGGRRYGFFEHPSGLARDLVFRAENVPPLGYRTYRLQPRADKPTFVGEVSVSETVVENAFYRLEVDPSTGFVRSIVDKETGRELADENADHPFGALVVRDPCGCRESAVCTGVRSAENGPVRASLRVAHRAWGHPCVETTYTLHTDEKRIDVAVGLLKDPTPLLEAYLAFPFRLPEGRFRYGGALSIIDPCRDLLPGAYADRLTVQDWVAVSDGNQSILWSSLDAPVVSLARLWPGRVSPAHSAVVRGDLQHPCQTAVDLQGGSVYSLLTANNFGTNFAVSQNGALLFRYSITTAPGELSDADAAELGRAACTSMPTIFTKHPGSRPLSTTGCFLAIDHPAVQLVTLKHAEDGNGLILRVSNTSREPVSARLELPAIAVESAALTTLTEEDTDQPAAFGPHHVDLTLAPRQVVTLRITGAKP